MSSCLRKKRPIKQSTKTEIIPTNISNLSDSKQSDHKKEIRQTQESGFYQQTDIKNKPTLYFSIPQTLINKPDNNVKFANQQIPPPPPMSQQGQGKLRNLSPATLGQMLSAELDHFLKVEQNIAQIAEVETNVEAARHEHLIANQIQFEDDTEELEELEKLDAEIARLEAIYEQKLNEQTYDYSYSYSNISENE